MPIIFLLENFVPTKQIHIFALYNNMSNMETWQIILSIVGSALATLGLVIGFLWKIFDKVSNIDRCVTRIDNLETRLSKIEENNSYYNERLIRIETALSIKYKTMENMFSQKHSPRTLNSLGLQIYQMLDGDKFLEENKQFLFEEIDKREPKAALDVETLASVALAVSVSKDWFIPIKTFVYNCPTLKTEGGNDLDVSLETACYVMSLPLRDMYLEAHPEIPK